MQFATGPPKMFQAKNNFLLQVHQTCSCAALHWRADGDCTDPHLPSRGSFLLRAGERPDTVGSPRTKSAHHCPLNCSSQPWWQNVRKLGSTISFNSCYQERHSKTYSYNKMYCRWSLSLIMHINSLFKHRVSNPVKCFIWLSCSPTVTLLLFRLWVVFFFFLMA